MIALAYFFLGLLVGVISGLTSSPVSSALMAALFTFVGGTGAYFLNIKPSDRKLISLIIFAFSFSCLIGLFSGIYLKVNRRLDLSEYRGTSDYLKAADFGRLEAINQKYTGHLISADEAYRDMWVEVQRIETEKK